MQRSTVRCRWHSTPAHVTLVIDSPHCSKDTVNEFLLQWPSPWLAMQQQCNSYYGSNDALQQCRHHAANKVHAPSMHANPSAATVISMTYASTARWPGSAHPPESPGCSTGLKDSSPTSAQKRSNLSCRVASSRSHIDPGTHAIQGTVNAVQACQKCQTSVGKLARSVRAHAARSCRD